MKIIYISYKFKKQNDLKVLYILHKESKARQETMYTYRINYTKTLYMLKFHLIKPN